MSYILVIGANSELANKLIKSKLKRKKLILITSTTTKLEKIKKEFKGFNIIFFVCDLGSYKSIDLFISFLKKKKIFLKSLIYYPGINIIKPIKLINQKETQKIFNINVIYFINIISKLNYGNLFLKNSSVLCVSSIITKKHSVGMSLYSSTKASLNDFIQSAALEFSKDLIRFNSINLGHISLGMGLYSTKFLSKNELNDFEKKYPLGFGKSKNLNDLIIFLLSDKSSWITGVNIDLDGGYKL